MTNPTKQPRFKPFPTREDCRSRGVSTHDSIEAWYIETAKAMSAGEIDTLMALVRAGPLDDGDVPSKGDRDTLLDLGLASKCVVSGRAMPKAAFSYVTPPPLLPPDEIKPGFAWGYQVATYRGAYVYKALLELKLIKP